MRLLVTAVLVAACAAVAAPTATAAFAVRPPLVTSELSDLAAPVVDVNARGALLTAFNDGASTFVRDRTAAGLLGEPQELVPGRAFAVQAVLDDAGGALVAVSTDVGTVLLERPAGGTFGPAEPLGGEGSRVQALEVDGAGNAAVVLGERLGQRDARLVLRLRPTGGALGGPITLTGTEAEARLAFGPRGALAVAWVVQDDNFRGVRVEARTGTAARGVGATQIVARRRAVGYSSIDGPSVAVAAGGRAIVAFATTRDTARSSSRDVRVAEAGPSGRFSRPRVLAADSAYDARVAAGGGTVAVAWTSTSPRPGRAGVRVAVRGAGGAFAASQGVAPPQRGFKASGGLGPAVPGATESFAGAPTLAVSRRGDVAVTFALGSDFGPSTVLAAVRLRGSTRFDGPQPISPLGSSARPLEPEWTRDGTVAVPFASVGARGGRLSAAVGVGLAVRAPGSASAPRLRDHEAPRVRLTEPTAAHLRAGRVASRVTCAEACAFTFRAQVNVSNDIGKPRSDGVVALEAGRSTIVSLPLQDSQREGLEAGGARVRAVLALAVVDRFGNARTARARICVPRRRPC